MKNKALIYIIVLAVIGIVIWFFAAGPRGALQKTSLQLVWLNQAEHAGFYAADQAGFYKKEGLDVDIIEGGLDVQGIDAVLAGEADFGVDSADQLILERAKGNDLVGLAVIFRKSPVVFFAKKSSGITTPFDFVGKTVGRKTGDAQDIPYLIMMEQLGIDRSFVNEVEIRFDLTPFFNDEVDVWNGFAINEPLASKRAGFPVNVINPADFGIDVYADVILARAEFIEQNPDLVERFLRATLNGWDFVVKNPDKGVEFTMNADPELNPDHQKEMMEAEIPLIDTGEDYIGWMKPEVWAEIHNNLLEFGFLDEPIEIEKAYNTEFLERIYKVGQ